MVSPSNSTYVDLSIVKKCLKSFEADAIFLQNIN